jgi:preprotein translocase subunit YajC
MTDITAPIVLAAMGPPSGTGWGGAVTQLLPLLAIFAIFYFLLIRPQQKQKQDRARMLAAVKKGDRIVTTGGLHGTIVGLNEHTVILRVADQVKLELDRAAIGRVVELQSDKDA